VVDVTVGVTEEDARVAQVLQRATNPVIVAVNKVDDERRESDIWQFASLGLGDPVPVSALHGRLSGELLDAIVKVLPPEQEHEADAHTREDDGIFSVAIVGRPNVGKSTLFNRLVGRRLALVDDRPGVTRDRREGEGRIADLEFRVVDTAGPGARAASTKQPSTTAWCGAPGDRPRRAASSSSMRPKA
jgi:GTP-binding protein